LRVSQRLARPTMPDIPSMPGDGRAQRRLRVFGHSELSKQT
jgi:hypothetical protein